MPADIEKLLKKTGQTHYTFEELEVDLGENLFVPGSVLKKLKKKKHLHRWIRQRF